MHLVWNACLMLMFASYAGHARRRHVDTCNLVVRVYKFTWKMKRLSTLYLKFLSTKFHLNRTVLMRRTGRQTDGRTEGAILKHLLRGDAKVPRHYTSTHSPSRFRIHDFRLCVAKRTTTYCSYCGIEYLCTMDEQCKASTRIPHRKRFYVCTVFVFLLPCVYTLYAMAVPSSKKSHEMSTSQMQGRIGL
jgi:hypothetical protein